MDKREYTVPQVEVMLYKVQNVLKVSSPPDTHVGSPRMDNDLIYLE